VRVAQKIKGVKKVLNNLLFIEFIFNLCKG